MIVASAAVLTQIIALINATSFQRVSFKCRDFSRLSWFISSVPDLVGRAPSSSNPAKVYAMLGLLQFISERRKFLSGRLYVCFITEHYIPVRRFTFLPIVHLY